MKDDKLYYVREAKKELLALIDTCLVGFVDNELMNDNIYPAEFTSRMIGAMSLAGMLKGRLVVKEEDPDDAG